MAHLLFRFLVAASVLALAGVAVAQPQTGPLAPEAFALQIEAPEEIAALLERHLELQRYRQLPDLSDTEIQSLLLAARQDASGLLATLGYFSPDIQIQLLPAGNTAAGAAAARVVRMGVQAGPQTRVGSVRLVLLGAVTQDEAARDQAQAVQDLWTMPSGDPFTQAGWDAAKEHALQQLLERRYPAARLLSSQVDVDAQSARAELDLQLDSGPAFTLGRLEVAGSTRYGEELVQRFVRLQPGQAYVQSELVEAQARLTDSGYFDSAYLTLDLASDPAQAVVRAQVREANMQKLVLGLGASTDSGGRWSAEHTYNQVPGIGWRAVNKVTQARDTRSFASDWTSQPGESHWRWAASALFQQDKVAEIAVDIQRYRAGRFSTEAGLDQNYYLQFEHTDASYLEQALRNANEAVSANYAFALRRFDSTPFPSSGWGLGAELGAGSVLGSGQEPYSRLLLHGLAYQPLGQQQNLFARQHAGRMVYRAQLGGVFVNNAVNVPFSQLFLTGGDSTVRGYKHEEIGVTRDGVLSADSGRYLATAGVEWQRPIVRNGLMTDWESAVFIDTGAVANKVDELSFKVGVGVGARWKSPIGPLQIDAAYGVATQSFRLHLNVGFVF